jgi:hypothetical protein
MGRRGFTFLLQVCNLLLDRIVVFVQVLEASAGK